MRRNNSQKGFTIVETMIVLAIAGLILLIIMLALPTLQRNSRNNQRKQDVSSVLQAVSRWGLNRSGEFPAGLNGADKSAFLSSVRLTYYTGADIYLVGRSNDQNGDHDLGDFEGMNEVNESSVLVTNYARCSDSGTGNTLNPWGVGYNDIVAIYLVETRTGTVQQCQEL